MTYESISFHVLFNSYTCSLETKNKIFKINIMAFVLTSSKEEELIEFWQPVSAL